MATGRSCLRSLAKYTVAHPALPQFALDGVAVGEGGAEVVEGAHRGKLARDDAVHYCGVRVRWGIPRPGM